MVPMMSLHGSKASLNGSRASHHAFRVTLHDSRVIFMAQGEPPTFILRKHKAVDTSHI
jgi:hypothetical protein